MRRTKAIIFGVYLLAVFGIMSLLYSEVYYVVAIQDNTPVHNYGLMALHTFFLLLPIPLSYLFMKKREVRYFWVSAFFGFALGSFADVTWSEDEDNKLLNVYSKPVSYRFKTGLLVNPLLVAANDGEEKIGSWKIDYETRHLYIYHKGTERVYNIKELTDNHLLLSIGLGTITTQLVRRT